MSKNQDSNKQKFHYSYVFLFALITTCVIGLWWFAPTNTEVRDVRCTFASSFGNVLIETELNSEVFQGLPKMNKSPRALLPAPPVTELEARKAIKLFGQTLASLGYIPQNGVVRYCSLNTFLDKDQQLNYYWNGSLGSPTSPKDTYAELVVLMDGKIHQPSIFKRNESGTFSRIASEIKIEGNVPEELVQETNDTKSKPQN